MNNPIVLAEKTLHKGVTHASCSSGNPCLSISDGIALRFVALNERFVTIQVLHYGTGVQVKSQSWYKAKAVKKPEVKQSELELVEEVKEEELL